jgi:hypothetical protein
MGIVNFQVENILSVRENEMKNGKLNGQVSDKRPEPKPRKNAALWQIYLIYDELLEMRKRHKLRISSIERGKSSFDLFTETAFLERLNIDGWIETYRKEMVNIGSAVGPVWDWLASHKGLKAGTHSARVLALIDDIEKFETVSKLWRFCGYSVMADGTAERRKRGQKATYNAKLKAAIYLVVDSFIRQQTPGYSDYYYEVKKNYREQWPVKVENEPGSSPWPYRYTDSHIHRMAIRKVAKLFLQHLWVIWRVSEGLPVTLPWVFNDPAHMHYIPPFHDLVINGELIRIDYEGHSTYEKTDQTVQTTYGEKRLVRIV